MRKTITPKENRQRRIKPNGTIKLWLEDSKQICTTMVFWNQPEVNSKNIFSFPLND